MSENGETILGLSEVLLAEAQLFSHTAYYNLSSHYLSILQVDTKARFLPSSSFSTLTSKEGAHALQFYWQLTFSKNAALLLNELGRELMPTQCLSWAR